MAVVKAVATLWRRSVSLSWPLARFSGSIGMKRARCPKP
jgi:hypothetical protein